MKKTEVVVLAAGLGKRMQSDLPKVLNTLHGKPLVQHVLDAIAASGVCESPVVVVGQKKKLVMEALGSGYRYAVQDEQLGTGHAVLSAASLLEGAAAQVMVLYGDMPYITPDSIRAIAEKGETSGADIVMATVTVPDFDGWRAPFYDFGRVVRDAGGKVLKIAEKKERTDDELAIMEVVPCYFSFKGDWLWNHLRSLKNINAQGEYYLTDLVGMAVREGAAIETLSINPKEALGANTKADLDMLHQL